MKYSLLLFIATLMVWACNTQQGGTQIREDVSSSIILREFVYDTASFPSSHASTILETQNGNLFAAWFGGEEEGADDVVIWLSERTGSGWSVPVQVADGVMDDEVRYPCWNPVLVEPIHGPLQLYYKVGPNPREWWGMLIESTDEGKTWSEPVRLADGYLGPVRNKALQLDKDIILFPSSTEHDGWRVHVERSADGGSTWSRIDVENESVVFDAIQPAFLQLADGRLQMLCRSKQGVITTSFSEDKGLTWSPMTATELPNPNSGIDALTMKDGRHVLVYNPTTPPPDKWGGPRSPLVVAVSAEGSEWEQVAILESEKGAEFSYPAIIQGNDGSLHITYTWKRDKIRYVKMTL